MIKKQASSKIISEYFIHREDSGNDPISFYLILLYAEILGNLIRNTENVMGITIKRGQNTKYRNMQIILQFLDGSPEIMDKILRE